MSACASVPPPLPSSQCEGNAGPVEAKTEKDARRRSIQEITGKNNFVDAYREAIRIKHNMELSDAELVWAITENWNDILKAKERGEFTQTDLDQVITSVAHRTREGRFSDVSLTLLALQMRKFLDGKRREIIKPAHSSIDFWIEMLEGLLGAHRAFSRIEELLESFALTRPQQLGRASTLFRTLSKLPKVASPDWVDPTTKGSKARIISRPEATEDDGTSESLTYIQMHHSFVYTSKGIVLFPEDVVGILSRDMKLFREFNRDKKLTQKQISRVSAFLPSFKACYLTGYGGLAEECRHRIQSMRGRKEGLEVPA